MHQFGWLSESQKEGGNFLNLLQKEGCTQKGGGSLRSGGIQPWRKLCTNEAHGKWNTYMTQHNCMQTKQNIKSMRPKLRCNHMEADTMLVAHAPN